MKRYATVYQFLMVILSLLPVYYQRIKIFPGHVIWFKAHIFDALEMYNVIYTQTSACQLYLLTSMCICQYICLIKERKNTI